MLGQARSYQARAPKVATHALAAQGKAAKSLSSRRKPLRSHSTPEDAKALKATVSTFPKSAFYDMETLLTGMGIGQAAVTILSESGVPTPVVHTRMTPPASRMGAADDVDGKAKASPLWAKYGQRVDNESAREILAARMAPPAEAAAPAGDGAGQARPAPAAQHKQAASAVGGGVAAVTAFLQSKEGKQLEKEVMRGVFGLLKKRR